MVFNIFIRKLKRFYNDHILWNVGEVVCKKMFKFWQALGFHVTRNFYNEPIPDTRALKESLWTFPTQLIGIDLNESYQLNLLRDLSKYKDEYNQFPKQPTSNPVQYYLENPHYQSVDAEITYSMIRHFKPQWVMEIGSGYTTTLMAQAVVKNAESDKHKTDLVVIDYDPRQHIQKGFPGLSKVIIANMENLDLSTFTQLQKDDIFFIDSSHVLRIGGDVKYEYLEILPRLNKGVIVHIHDIFLPYEYPKDWVLGDLRFWTEQYLLQALLTFNNEFEILWAGQYMHRKHPDILQQAFSSYNPHTTSPASFWIRRKI